ncbi:MAG: helix-turn-helix transcriptional regulator [Cyanobacteriota bacterium]
MTIQTNKEEKKLSTEKGGLLIPNFISMVEDKLVIVPVKVEKNNNKICQYKTIAEWVKIERYKAGLEQRELSEMTGISRAMIGSIETGRNRPSIENAFLICESLKIDVDSFCKKLEQEIIDKYVTSTKDLFKRKLLRYQINK